MNVAQHKKSKVVVWNTGELKDALNAGYAPENITLPSEDVAARITRARQEGYSEGLAAGRSEIISTAADSLDPQLKTLILKAESERITAIQALTEPGFETLAKEAILNIWSLEQFALAQLRDKKDRGITLEAIRRGAPKAASHWWPGDDAARTPGMNAGAIFEKRMRDTEKAQR